MKSLHQFVNDFLYLLLQLSVCYEMHEEKVENGFENLLILFRKRI